VSHPRILGIGTANPPVRLTQEQSFHAAGYQCERIRKSFLNSGIDLPPFLSGRRMMVTSVDNSGDPFAGAFELLMSSPRPPVVTFC
jgi:hypothetical protein